MNVHRKRILLTGMSGVGKSTLLSCMQSDQVFCLDLDNSEWMQQNPLTGERMIRTDALLHYLASRPEPVILLAGCESNQRELYPDLDAVVLMTAPLDVMKERVRNRSENPYGKSEEEWEQIVRNKEEVEPLIARNCTHILDTDCSLAEAIEKMTLIIEENL